MKQAVSHYSQCEKVEYIYIIWSEDRPPPPTYIKAYARYDNPKVYIVCAFLTIVVTTSNYQVEFLVFEEDSLNNRFKPISKPHTDGIFSIDDDMQVPCNELDFAFDVWRTSKDSIVGFMPRVHIRGSEGQLVYRCWWRVWWYGTYSIILTKAAFLHHKFFELYTHGMDRRVREYVDKNRNCEDIAMQFLTSNVTKLPPVFVKGHLTDMGALNGISTSKNFVTAGHMTSRSQCLRDLAGLFGGNPLLETHTIVDSATNRWFNAPSTWFEFISSDLWSNE